MFGIDPQRSPNVVVVGDVMLDRYTFGVADRVSPESPVLVVKATRREIRLGGAGNVAANCQTLGASVQVLGLIGDDSEGRTLSNLLAEQRISSMLIRDEGRCTTVKERILGQAANRTPQHILRLDCESSAPASPAMEDSLLDRLQGQWFEVNLVLISDYGKGVCTEALIRNVVATARLKGIPAFVDPAIGADWARYAGAALIKPNRKEAEIATGLTVRSIRDAELAAAKISTEYDIPTVVVTLDRDGVLLFDRNQGVEHFACVQRDVSDVTGAGDTVLAVLGVAFAHGLSLEASLQLANTAGGIQIGRQGATSITWQDIFDQPLQQAPQRKIASADWLQARCQVLRDAGKKIVFTNGCFDLLHAGHVTYLQQAAALGDVLVVAMNNDASTRRLKGPSRPINRELNRAAVLAALECVDHVVLYEEDTPESLLRSFRPHVLVKGGDYSLEEVVGREIVQLYGGEVLVLPAVPDISTSLLASKARLLNCTA